MLRSRTRRKMYAEKSPLFDHVKANPEFAERIKTLRIHWAYEEGDLLDLMLSECPCHWYFSGVLNG